MFHSRSSGPATNVTRRRFLLGSAGLALGLAGCGKDAGTGTRVGFMPKLTGIPYFNACKKGAEEAVAELKLRLEYNGPTGTDSGKQVEILSHWVSAAEVDVICIACNDPSTPAPALRDARQAGIPVITYDADTLPDARDFFVNQATYDSVAEKMVDELVPQLPGGRTEIGILTSSVQAPNQSEWARRIRAYVKKKYPHLTVLQETEHGEDRDLGIRRANELIQTTPGLAGILGLTSVAVPAAAEAVRQKEKKGQIAVGGVSTPRDMRDYVQDGTVKSFVLWSPVDLGYLAVWVAHLQKQGKMPASGTIQAGRLKDIQVADGVVLLGEPMVFTKENIDRYEF